MSAATPENFIDINDVSYLNLRDFSCRLRCNSLNVISGESGAGKTALAFGVLHYEMQRVCRLLASDHSSSASAPDKKSKTILGQDGASAGGGKSREKSERSSVSDRRTQFIEPIIPGLSPVFTPIAISYGVLWAPSFSGLQSTDFTNRPELRLSEVFGLDVLLEKLTETLSVKRCSVCDHKEGKEKTEVDTQTLKELMSIGGDLFGLIENVEGTLDSLAVRGFSRFLYEGEEIFLEDLPSPAPAWLEFHLDTWEKEPSQETLEHLKFTLRDLALNFLSLSLAGKAPEQGVSREIIPAHVFLGSSPSSCHTCSVCLGNYLWKSSANVTGVLSSSIDNKVGDIAIADLGSLQIIEINKLVKRLEGGKGFGDGRSILSLLEKLGFGSFNPQIKLRELPAKLLDRLPIVLVSESEMSGAAIFLEEPTSGMADSESLATIEALQSLANRGNTLVVTASEPLEIEDVCNLELPGPRSFSDAFEEAVPERCVEREGRLELLDLSSSGSLDIPKGDSSEESELSVLFPDTELVDLRLDFQSSQARTRSNLMSWLGIWPDIRELILLSPEAKARGLAGTDLSLSRSKFRCGEKHRTYNCPFCDDTGFTGEILSLRLKGLSLASILTSDFRSLQEKFSSWHKGLSKKFSAIELLGFGHLPLNRPVSFLSQGEFRKAFFAKHLAIERSQNKTFLIENPLLGFSAGDKQKVCNFLSKQVDSGLFVVCQLVETKEEKGPTSVDGSLLASI